MNQDETPSKLITKKVPFEIHDRAGDWVATITIDVYENFGEDFVTSESSELIHRVKSLYNKNIEYPIYSVQRCKDDDSKYGEIHFANDEFKTLCGIAINQNWWFLTNDHDGFSTCEKCNKKVFK
jgi:hypothetical protein